MYEGVEGVYLIHFESALSGARHYIGWSSNIAARLKKHQAGQSNVALTRAVSQSGIRMSVVRVWADGGRSLERKLKMRKKARMMCPICNPLHWENNGNEQG